MPQEIWIEVRDQESNKLLWGPGPMPCIPRTGEWIILQEGPVAQEGIEVVEIWYSMTKNHANPITNFSNHPDVPPGVGVVQVRVHAGVRDA